MLIRECDANALHVSLNAEPIITRGFVAGRKGMVVLGKDFPIILGRSFQQPVIDSVLMADRV